ncbi:MAG: GLPGLI family protein [Bacteroidetes bacterium]|nr:MAG: GLPGLI family protein [Bacteroidota bacterium]
MKHLVVFLFFLLPYSMGVAQSILVEYEQKWTPNNATSYYETWVADSISAYKGKASLSGIAPLIKNKKKGVLYNNEKYISKDFFVKDSLHNFKWELLSDTATILKRKCLSAKTTFRGREYKVFYAPEIPVSDGPWKLGGLPGLILEAKTTDGFVSWRAVKLDLAYKGTFKYADVSKNSYMDWATYVTKHKETVDKIVHKMRTDDDLKGSKMKLQNHSIEIFYPELQINGIEIEGD